MGPSPEKAAEEKRIRQEKWLEKKGYTLIEKTRDSWPKSGSNLIQVKGAGLVMVNRKVARTRQVDRAFTTSNYDYQHKMHGFEHKVNEPNAKLELPLKSPKISNHTAHRQRQIQRMIDKGHTPK